MKIYITRHGETVWNLDGRAQGWKNSNLTEKGIENAKKLGESLKDIEFGCIYSSPLGRAFETAKYIRGNKKTEIILDENFREINLGVMEGMKYSEIKEKYPTHNENMLNNPHLYESIEGENFNELFDRVKIGLDNIIKNDKYENVLVVTHAFALKTIYAIVKNYSMEEFWNPPFIHDTSLTILEVVDKKINITLEADTSHLEKMHNIK